MNIVKRIKLWWKSTPAKDKVLFAVSGVSVAASVVSIGACLHMKHSVDDVKVDVKLYPGGKDDPNPVDLTPEGDSEPAIQKIPADTSSDKWEVWNPEWLPRYESADGYESTRLFDALEVLQKFDNINMDCDEFDDCATEAQARVEDLARQFAYLEGNEDEFRKRFPSSNSNTVVVYKNVVPEGKKGE